MELTGLPLLVAGSREETFVESAFFTQCGRPRSTDD
jgi:hypothetical protein